MRTPLPFRPRQSDPRALLYTLCLLVDGIVFVEGLVVVHLRAGGLLLCLRRLCRCFADG
jgi:hypothetical protein